MTSLQTSWSFLTSQDALHSCTVSDKEFRSPQQEKHSSSGAWGDLWGSLHNTLFISSVQGFCLKWFLTASTKMVSNTDSQWKEWMRSGRHSQTCRLFVWMGSCVSLEDIKQRSRRCCYRWVGCSCFCVCVRVRVCACVRGKRAHKHMCTYGGGSRGNEEDEMMTICPLSCPWGLEDRGSSQAELDACHSWRGGDVGGWWGTGRERWLGGCTVHWVSWEP